MRGRLVEDRIEERICKIRVIDGVIANYYPQEELIRCKDCKHWQYESCFVESEEGDAESIILDRFAFDFCSRAERKNDETD